MKKFIDVKNSIAIVLVAGLTSTVSAYDMTDGRVKSDVNWENVPVVEKTLFFPGMITFDWINSDKHEGSSRPDFATKTCANCHEVTRQDRDAELPWYVQPVRLTTSFFPHANFSHAAHDTEVTSCDGCHGASTSESSQDVLIPGIDSCRDCHGSGNSSRNNSSQSPSACIMCHSFHFEAKGPHQ